MTFYLYYSSRSDHNQTFNDLTVEVFSKISEHIGHFKYMKLINLLGDN